VTADYTLLQYIIIHIAILSAVENKERQWQNIHIIYHSQIVYIKLQQSIEEITLNII